MFVHVPSKSTMHVSKYTIHTWILCFFGHPQKLVVGNVLHIYTLGFDTNWIKGVETNYPLKTDVTEDWLCEVGLFLGGSNNKT